jgi:DHA3 family macrolide efflux protein-like MFS transporter
MMLIATVFHIMFSPAAFLTPLQVTRNFGADVWRLTAIEIAFSAGMMIGGLLIGFRGGFKNKIHSMSLACVLFGLLSVAAR